MTMILRVHYVGESYRIVHYVDTTIWYPCFIDLRNDQLKSAIRLHGVDCDFSGWIWND